MNTLFCPTACGGPTRETHIGNATSRTWEPPHVSKNGVDRGHTYYRWEDANRAIRQQAQPATGNNGTKAPARPVLERVHTGGEQLYNDSGRTTVHPAETPIRGENEEQQDSNMIRTTNSACARKRVRTTKPAPAALPWARTK